jgi:hypothetical protein
LWDGKGVRRFVLIQWLMNFTSQLGHNIEDAKGFLIANVDVILTFLLMFLLFVDVYWDGSVEIPKALKFVVMTLSLIRAREESTSVSKCILQTNN